MLTALDSEADAVQGLEAGADDYVTKPFGLAELRSRIRAVLRRAQGRVVEGNLRVGPVTLDRDLRRVTVEDNPVRLTFSEFELLGCLMSRPGYAFNRQELLRAIWGDSAYRDPRAIDVHIRHLREKLEAAPGGAEPDPDRPGPGLPLPGGMIRRALRGLRGRLLLAFVLTSAVTLVVAAAITLGPLQSRLRDESADGAAATPTEDAALGRSRPRSTKAGSSERKDEATLRAAERPARAPLDELSRPRYDLRERTGGARVLVADPAFTNRPAASAPAFLFDTDFGVAARRERAARSRIRALRESYAETAVRRRRAARSRCRSSTSGERRRRRRRRSAA